MVKKYLAQVCKIENKVEGIYTLELESLNGPFKYVPGQFMHLALDEYDPSTGWPESRCFSMQSSPGEEHIRITYANKGTFTSRMSKELKPGSHVTLKLPYGDLFLQAHSKSKTVFIAGGTGVTPFLSLFTDASFSFYEHPVLYLGIRSEKFNLYEAELAAAKRNNPYLTALTIIEDKDGKLDIEKIFMQNGFDPSYFLSGPPLMIEHFKTVLYNHNVPKQHIFLDTWN